MTLIWFREKAQVDVDEQCRITKYVAKDGSLHLEGKHRRSHARCRSPKNRSSKTNDIVYYHEEDKEVKKETSSRAPKRQSTLGFHQMLAKRFNEQNVVIDSVTSEASHSSNIARSLDVDAPSLEVQVPAHILVISHEDEPIQVPVIVKIEPDGDKEDTLIKSSKILKFLRGLVATLYSPIFFRVQQKIENQLEIVTDEKIHVENVHLAFRIALLALIKSGRSMDLWQADSTTSLRGFLMMFCCSLVNLDCALLSDIQEDIKRAVDVLGNEDRSISIESVEMVLGTVLLAVSV